jgi:hypothetical protein
MARGASYDMAFTAICAEKERNMTVVSSFKRSHLLNGWKEIAHYVNRGKRTVQRWEQLGLPVRRPNQRRRSAVIAVPQEIDHWIRSTADRSLTSANDEITALKKRNAELEAENAALREALKRISAK